MKRSVFVLMLLVSCALAIGAAGCQDLGADTTTDASQTTVAPDLTMSTSTTMVPITVVETAAPTRWTKLTPVGEPLGRNAVCDPTTGRVLLLDGDSALYVYDPAANTWTALSPAGDVPSAGGPMVYDPLTGKVLLFTGDVQGQQFLSELWAYDPAADTWTEVHPAGEVPSGRIRHALVYDSKSGKVILFGGNGGNTLYLDDLWAYDPIANTWTELHPVNGGPVARGGHEMAYDPTTGKVFVFGGESGEYSFPSVPEFIQNLWAYDPIANTWAKLKPDGDRPYGRVGHSMVYHPGSGLIILFGGKSDLHHLYPEGDWFESQPDDIYPDDLRAYDPVANAWAKLEPADRAPNGRSGHAMTYEARSGKIIMVGGSNGGRAQSGTWILTP